MLKMLQFSHERKGMGLVEGPLPAYTSCPELKNPQNNNTQNITSETQ